MSKGSQNRFSDESDPYDFNATPRTRRANTLSAQKRAADKLATARQRKRLIAFFDSLDRAHDLWGKDSKKDRDALQIALGAVVALVEASRENKGKRYSHLFERLAERLKPMQMVEQVRRGGDRDARTTNTKAATAYLVDYLAEHGGHERKVRQLCRWTAAILTERGFPFSGKNASAKSNTKAILAARATTIEHWRRDYSRGGFGGAAGELFRKYKFGKRPFQVQGLGTSRTDVALQWWFDELSKNRL